MINPSMIQNVAWSHRRIDINNETDKSLGICATINTTTTTTAAASSISSKEAAITMEKISATVATPKHSDDNKENVSNNSDTDKRRKQKVLDQHLIEKTTEEPIMERIDIDQSDAVDEDDVAEAIHINIEQKELRVERRVHTRQKSDTAGGCHGAAIRQTDAITSNTMKLLDAVKTMKASNRNRRRSMSKVSPMNDIVNNDRQQQDTDTMDNLSKSNDNQSPINYKLNLNVGEHYDEDATADFEATLMNCILRSNKKTTATSTTPNNECTKRIVQTPTESEFCFTDLVVTSPNKVKKINIITSSGDIIAQKETSCDDSTVVAGTTTTTKSQQRYDDAFASLKARANRFAESKKNAESILSTPTSVSMTKPIHIGTDDISVSHDRDSTDTSPIALAKSNQHIGATISAETIADIVACTLLNDNSNTENIAQNTIVATVGKRTKLQLVEANTDINFSNQETDNKQVPTVRDESIMTLKIQNRRYDSQTVTDMKQEKKCSTLNVPKQQSQMNDIVFIPFEEDETFEEEEEQNEEEEEQYDTFQQFDECHEIHSVHPESTRNLHFNQSATSGLYSTSSHSRHRRKNFDLLYQVSSDHSVSSATITSHTTGGKAVVDDEDINEKEIKFIPFIEESIADVTGTKIRLKKGLSVRNLSIDTQPSSSKLKGTTNITTVNNKVDKVPIESDAVLVVDPVTPTKGMSSNRIFISGFRLPFASPKSPKSPPKTIQVVITSPSTLERTFPNTIISPAHN